MALPKKKRSRAGDIDLKQPDEFITLTSRSLSWGRTNRRPLVASAVVLVVVVALVAGLRELNGRKAAERSARLASAVEALSATLSTGEELDEPAAPNPLNPTPRKDGPTFPSSQARAQDVLVQLADVEGSGGAGALAQLGRAAAYLDLGEADKAEAAYRAYLDASLGHDFRFFGLDGLVTALADQGSHDAALKEADNLAQLKGGVYADHAALRTGHILEAKGDAAGARAAYKRLVETYPKSLLKDRAQKRLDLLGG